MLLLRLHSFAVQTSGTWPLHPIFGFRILVSSRLCWREAWIVVAWKLIPNYFVKTMANGGGGSSGAAAAFRMDCITCKYFSLRARKRGREYVYSLRYRRTIGRLERRRGMNRYATAFEAPPHHIIPSTMRSCAQHMEIDELLFDFFKINYGWRWLECVCVCGGGSVVCISSISEIWGRRCSGARATFTIDAMRRHCGMWAPWALSRHNKRILFRVVEHRQTLEIQSLPNAEECGCALHPNAFSRTHAHTHTRSTIWSLHADRIYWWIRAFIGIFVELNCFCSEAVFSLLSHSLTLPRSLVSCFIFCVDPFVLCVQFNACLVLSMSIRFHSIIFEHERSEQRSECDRVATTRTRTSTRCVPVQKKAISASCFAYEVTFTVS